MFFLKTLNPLASPDESIVNDELLIQSVPSNLNVSFVVADIIFVSDKFSKLFVEYVQYCPLVFHLSMKSPSHSAVI